MYVATENRKSADDDSDATIIIIYDYNEYLDESSQDESSTSRSRKRKREPGTWKLSEEILALIMLIQEGRNGRVTNYRGLTWDWVS